jgi:hypothetical protein
MEASMTKIDAEMLDRLASRTCSVMHEGERAFGFVVPNEGWEQSINQVFLLKEIIALAKDGLAARTPNEPPSEIPTRIPAKASLRLVRPFLDEMSQGIHTAYLSGWHEAAHYVESLLPTPWKGARSPAEVISGVAARIRGRADEMAAAAHQQPNGLS